MIADDGPASIELKVDDGPASIELIVDDALASVRTLQEEQHILDKVRGIEEKEITKAHLQKRDHDKQR